MKCNKNEKNETSKQQAENENGEGRVGCSAGTAHKEAQKATSTSSGLSHSPQGMGDGRSSCYMEM